MNDSRNTKSTASGLTEAEEKKFSAWKHGLLDIGGRNRMINFKKTSRTTLRITEPSMEDLYRRIAVNEESISFKRRVDTSSDARLTGLFFIMDKVSAPVELTKGEIGSDRPTDEMDLTLRNLRSRARLSLEEQGINILYLCLGFLEWRKKPSDPFMRSPLVMVPVMIERSSITAPYMLSKTEEDIVVNPTLEYVLSSEYGLELPAFDAAGEKAADYLDSVERAVSPLGWRVVRETCLGLLSFLKIVMYKDLEKDKQRIFANPVIKALCGNRDALPGIREEWTNFDHDSVPCRDTCMVVNADASQQDAIALSKKGVSFVLQGPPGTGKSQTITNIIAQALSDGKKVLFVSEKMAALSVVYRRLQDVGMADYCLALHNYKAEKKGVISELVNTLDAPVRELRPGVTDFLDDLEKERAELNLYFKELNENRAPLNMTIYEAVSELSQMESVPYYGIKDPVHSVTDREYRARLAELRKLEAVTDTVGRCDADHPWRNTVITAVTYEIEREIDRTLTGLAPCVFAAQSAMSLALPEGTDTEAFTWEDFRVLREGLAKSLFCDRIAGKAADVFRIEADPYKVLAAEYHNADQVLRTLSEEEARCRELGLSSGEIGTTEQMDAFLERTRRSIESAAKSRALIAEIMECIDAASSELGWDEKEHTVRSARRLEEELILLRDCEKLPAPWMDKHSFGEVKEFSDAFKRMTDEMEERTERIEKEWYSDTFLGLEADSMLERFRREYTGLFKWLNSSYKRDVNALTMASRNSGGRRLTDAQCIQALEELKEHREFSESLTQQKKAAMDILGFFYDRSRMDWEEIGWALNDYRRLDIYEKEYGKDPRIRELIKDERSQRTGIMLGKRTVGQWAGSGIFKEFRALDVIRKAEEGDARGADLYRIAEDLDHEIVRLEELHRAVTDLCGAAKEAEKMTEREGFGAPHEEAASLTAISAFLTRWVETASMIRKGAAVKKVLRDQFGIDTRGAGSMGPGGSRSGQSDLTEIFGDHVDEEAIRESAERVWTHFGEARGAFPEAFDKAWAQLGENTDGDVLFADFCKWFKGGEPVKCSLPELSDRIAGCRDIKRLHQWIAYSDVRESCIRIGLGDYIEYIERQKTGSGEEHPDLAAPYKKGFLTRWIIDTMTEERITSLLRFQSALHEHTISEFEKNDRKQLQLAQARLVNKLSAGKPSGAAHLANAMDEIAVLRKESEKRRRVMPLRKLFKAIPTLMLRLKPCFMMSPLTVSYFLDSELYKFDMVIFDEASQIFPEDAVGAIYRGSQTIVAGDTRQMPPTNFFNTTTMKEEFDTDEEEDYIVSDCESILDEAGACLPSCTLLWHYRSKDESLIAFSNKEIYNNRLITFPNCAKTRDKGLEYIYVPGGCYQDRSNIMEANRCVSLILEHIKEHPERSLGVIAFSEKQQAVIENAVSDFRLQNPQYEDFFDENKEEPFFVKNLENVQGDERDTILFSICYARNSQGRMYMRFGPLGAAGGERRLNVAITRAKYNVKLVGSILPTDIDLTRTRSEGVRLLRSYIYYAMQNDYTVPPGSENAVTGDTFADTVAAFLVKNGYQVRRSVGESGYKVDIAVVHPDRPDEYIAGIECDGRNYTMARTARDRDVLRKQIMSAAGWHLHHVWSFNWFRDMAGEKTRLLQFLEKVKRAGEGNSGRTPGPQTDAPDTGAGAVSAWDMVFEKEIEENSDMPVFEYYEVSDPSKVPHTAGKDYMSDLAGKIMFVMDKEAPIHRELLYKRLAPVFGNRKVTVLVRRTTDDCITRMLPDRIRIKDDFLYKKGQTGIRARIPKEGEEPRAMEHICREEICDAILTILRSAYSLTREDLTAETGRAFGFVRTGPRIRQCVEDSIRKLQGAGNIMETDGKLFIREDQNGI